MNYNLDIKTSQRNIDYLKAINFMETKVENILNKNHNEMIWFLNHNHIYTCGTSSKKDEIINKTNTPIIKTNRGGKTTYHGPGQRIVYLMIDLNKRKKDIRKFVGMIEDSIIELLDKLGVESETYNERVGIWIPKSIKNQFDKERKIAAIGVRIKKWITYHGLSFNINPNLNYYKNINACGLKNYNATSLYDLNIKISTKKFDTIFKNIFIKNLNNF
tara:strand:+ start:49 stop:699 length:651 start_codon:yes stop_codon:yes gene_type:complete